MIRILVAVLIFFIMSSQAVFAEKPRILLHTSDKRNMAMIEQAIENIVDEYGDEREIILVVNGAAVENFTNSLGKPEMVEKFSMHDVEIGVCHVALSRRGMAESDVLEHVKILENTGIVTLIKLQQEGYMYIKL